MEIALVLGLLVAAIILFSTERIGVDLVTGLLLVVLVLTGILTTGEAFAAFGTDFIVMLASIYVITNAVETSGVLDEVANRLSRSKPAKVVGLMLWLLPFTALMSAFMNNTTLTALLIPPVLALAKKSKLPASKLLMALAFSSIVGGTCTVIGTSTNIVVSAYLQQHGIATIGMFDFFGIGLVLVAVTLVYMMTLGRWLTPVREAPDEGTATAGRLYTSEIRVLAGSSLIGTRVGASELTASGFEVLSVKRNDHQLFGTRGMLYKEGDVVLVQGDVDTLLSVKDKAGIEILADELMAGNGKSEEVMLTEVLIPSSSRLVGSTIAQARFLDRYGLAVAAVHRAGERLSSHIGKVRLRVGDVLLVQGPPEALHELNDQHNLISLEKFTTDPKRVRKGYISIGLFLVAIVLSTTGLVPLAIAFLCAALATVLLRITDSMQAYTAIDWRLIILIGGMTAMGTAMVNSGADQFLSSWVVKLCAPMGVQGTLAGFMVLTVLLTQPMSNAAAALVVLPIAISAATALGASPVTFGMAVMLSASISLITPFEPSCVLVYTPGRYRFTDFLRVGGPLTAILLVVIFFLVQRQWPL
ncbi:MAG: SLC13 family permease [Flavobacteriales bacterium]|nr:SLC13 family permease [Flavobacteriales bacterium]